MNSLIIEITKEIMIAFRTGSVTVKRFVLVGLIFCVLALFFGGLGDSFHQLQYFTIPLAIGFGVSGSIFLFGVYIYRVSLESEAKERKYEEAEQRVKANPHETQAAWELARVKLESYVDGNLKQVRSIFWLTIFVMLAGFILIGFGVYTVIESPEKLAAAVIAAVSGVLVNFIGATFLVIYKSTINQAAEYVSILERINAVGMSVQILETLVDDTDRLKQKTTAELVKQLLTLYTKKA